MMFVHVYCCKALNVGDLYSSPVRYFDFASDFGVFDIWDNTKDYQIKDSILLIGGGGFLQHQSLSTKLNRLLAKKPRVAIGWGIGFNKHFKTERKARYLSRSLKSSFLGSRISQKLICLGFKPGNAVGAAKVHSDRSIKRFTLLGVRDDIPGLRWVPCVSCMHPVFDSNYSTVREVAIFEQSEFGLIDIEGIPKMDHRTSRIEEVIDFIGSSELLITSSYHGAYWGTLLNKRVIIINPWSTKFDNLKFQHPFARIEDWKKKIPLTNSYSNALNECRGANIDFSKDAEQLISKYR